MIKVIKNEKMGKSDLGWLKSSFHFSFAEYFKPSNMNFGVLRVLNDDSIDPHTGFDTHPHKNMEIVSYIIDGNLTHGDSMGNESTLSRGHMQYLSAGSGIFHKELNIHNEKARLLQIWIQPNSLNLKPNYGEFKFNWADRENKWLHTVSNIDGDAPIQINQDVNIYVLALDANRKTIFNIEKGRQAYLVQIEGNSVINSMELKSRDAMEIVEENISIKSKTQSHFLLIEMKKDNHEI